ncbi:hypothetical protein ACLOJK_016515, partial [Asimina triloba]
MACIDMFNTDHQPSLCAQMSPRISFSNDFADADHHLIKHERVATAQPPSTDFEFSVTSYRMIAADEIFFKGRLMPLKENCTSQLQKMTLRDELMHDDDDDDDEVSPTPPKGPVRWKELLGLKKGPSFGKKHEKIDGPLEQPAERKRHTNTAPAVETAHVSKRSNLSIEPHFNFLASNLLRILERVRKNPGTDVDIYHVERGEEEETERKPKCYDLDTIMMRVSCRQGLRRPDGQGCNLARARERLR